MLARCTHCENTFVTQQFGRQRCPKCGTEVFVEDPRPGAVQPPDQPPPLPESSSTGGIPAPWERRAELGVWTALGQTINLAITRPSEFFSRLRYDSDEGGLRFALLVAVGPMLVSQFVSWLATDPHALRNTLDQLKPFLPPLDSSGQQALDTILKYSEEAQTVRSLIASLFQTSIMMVLSLFMFAGVPHVVLALLGKAPGGWTTTFKVSVYSLAPMVVGVIPCAGLLIGMTWATGLQILGLSKAHRITLGEAVLGVLGFHALVLTCCCGFGALIMVAVAAGAGGAL